MKEMIIYKGPYSEEVILPTLIKYLDIASKKHGLLLFKSEQRLQVLRSLIVRYRTKMKSSVYFFSTRCSDDLEKIIDLYRSLEPEGYIFMGIYQGTNVTYSFRETRR